MLFEHGLFLCLLLLLRLSLCRENLCRENLCRENLHTLALAVPRNFTLHDFCQVAFSLCLVANSLLPCAVKNYTELNPIEQP